MNQRYTTINYKPLIAAKQKQNILVSGGIEQNIRGWNPFINTGPIFRLKGTSAVMHLMVNNERDLCIAVSVDKNVSIFSLKDQSLGKVIVICNPYTLNC